MSSRQRLRGRTVERVLGIDFLDEPVEESLALLERGGLMVVPSAPALTLLTTNAGYRAALLECDFAIVDSAYMALLWFALTGNKLRRVSGHMFIRAFLRNTVGSGSGELFMVNPTDDDMIANLGLLRSHGYNIDRANTYTAPQYDPASVEDSTLLAIVERLRPKYVLINLGGGIQEPLGLYLKQHLTFSPAIICTGAAIAFFTGRQARIPDWVDTAGLGWLWRIAAGPQRFLPRYVSSAKLAGILWRNRSELPPIEHR